jgi:hypothetical protein
MVTPIQQPPPDSTLPNSGSSNSTTMKDFLTFKQQIKNQLSLRNTQPGPDDWGVEGKELKPLNPNEKKEYQKLFNQRKTSIFD